MRGFSETKLGDTITLQRGFDITKAEQSPGSVPIVSSSGISSYHNKSKAEGKGVIIGRKGTLGTVHFLSQNYWPHDTTLWVKDFKGNEPHFISYFLRTLKLENFDTGASNPTLNRNHLHKIKVLFPKEIKTQRKIAAILVAYDDLIETNNRRIALLEKMAKELYREWFVRMRFPGHQNTKFVKGMPADWQIRELESLVTDIIDYRGLTPAKLGGHWDEKGIIALSALNVKSGELVRLDDSKRASEQLYERWMRKELEKHDILLTSEAPLGQVYFLAEEHRYVLSQRLFAIRADPSELSPAYLYQYLRYPIGQGQLESRATGATVGGIRQALLKKVEVIVPNRQILDSHESIVLPLLEEIHLLWKQNANLVKTRDLLLPRLISGKLSVEELDVKFPPSMQE